MSKRKRTMLAVGLLCGLLLAGAALANGATAIERHVIGSGGGHAEAGNCTLDGTIGQAIVGTASNNPFELCSGFWCGVSAQYSIYLPLVLRDS